MERDLKIKLICYLLISAFGFFYLVLPQNAGISVPVFALVQFVCLYFLLPKKKPLVMFIPIFILALNSFISANRIWFLSNILVITILYSVMMLMVTGRLRIKEVSIQFIINILDNAVTPFAHFLLPVEWCAKANKEQARLAGRIFMGIAVSVPCTVFLLGMLSSADQIFSHGIANFFDNIFSYISIETLLKMLFGFAAGFYLFGLVYAVYRPEKEKIFAVSERSGDLIVLNILLTSIIAVYSIFVIIQFRYLFAKGELPYGLTYTYYARRGFFELLFLSGLNILLILITVMLTKKQVGVWVKFNKILCCYLCVITVILLMSSFYRMWLYNLDDGLTRLRLLVFGFLVFEAVGLVFTFFYILKPKFNIIAVYLIIGLVYYLLLNILPMDMVIAKNQVDRYFNGDASGIDYTLTLSTDAAPQIARLLESDDTSVREQAVGYFEGNSETVKNAARNWRRYNLSVSGASRGNLPKPAKT